MASRYDYFSDQPWLLEPGHLDGLSPGAQEFFGRFQQAFGPQIRERHAAGDGDEKPGYPRYLELLTTLIRPGGWIAFDNVFAGGTVALEDAEVPPRRERMRANIRAFNAQLHADSRVDINMLGIGDGLTLAIVR